MQRAYLEPAFDQIERSDGRVGDAAREDTTETAEGIVLAAAKLARVGLTSRGGGRAQGATGRRGHRIVVARVDWAGKQLGLAAVEHVHLKIKHRINRLHRKQAGPTP